jgi:hypothetical protein
MALHNVDGEVVHAGVEQAGRHLGDECGRIVGGGDRRVDELTAVDRKPETGGFRSDDDGVLIAEIESCFGRRLLRREIYRPGAFRIFAWPTEAGDMMLSDTLKDWLGMFVVKARLSASRMIKGATVDCLIDGTIKLNVVAPSPSTPIARMSSNRVQCIDSADWKVRKVSSGFSSVQSSYVDSIVQSVRWRCTALMVRSFKPAWSKPAGTSAMSAEELSGEEIGASMSWLPLIESRRREFSGATMMAF